MTEDKRYGRDALPGYDEPVNIEGDPEELLKAILAPTIVVSDQTKLEDEAKQ